MPEQLDPPTADVAAPHAESGNAAPTCARGTAQELVALVPDELARAVAADDKAWQAVLRAKAEADP
ncbi:MAG TPA: hypothetical protein VFW33_17180, partial [Gemmataceae bacterium]|nr:hypothetical protein [Gemmataceae bacterium]